MGRRIQIGEKFIIDDLTYQEIIGYTDRLISSANGESHFIFSQNVLKLVSGRKSETVRDIVNDAEFIIPDGKGVLLLCKILGYKLQERVAGSTLFYKLLHHAADRGYQPYFLGARVGIAEKAARNLTEDFPSLEMAGVQHGYFQREEENGIIDQVNKSGADLLFVGMGSPMQEQFLHRNRNSIRVPVCMGVGGSFDVYAGELNRAPELVQKAGLEWLFRIIQQPGRLKQVLPGFLSFAGLMLTYKIKSYLHRDFITTRQNFVDV